MQKQSTEAREERKEAQGVVLCCYGGWVAVAWHHSKFMISGVGMA